MTTPDRLTAREAMLRQLRQWGACPEGMAWVRSTPATSFAELWPLFTRADWAAWLLDRVSDDLKLRTAIALEFAETVLPVYERAYPEDSRVRDCIATGRRWCEGKATDEEWQMASYRAKAAADNAAGSSVKAAAYAARSSAYARNAWTSAEAYVSWSTAAASHAELCDMIRKRVPDIGALAKAEGGAR